MRIDVLFADRVGIAHEILAMFAKRRLNVVAVEVDPPHIHIDAPELDVQTFGPLDAALRGGARALGADAGLAEGAPADLVALDLEHPTLAGRTGEALLDAWIFACRDNPVSAVWRRGRQVVVGGRHVAREEIIARYRQTLARVTA